MFDTVYYELFRSVTQHRESTCKCTRESTIYRLFLILWTISVKKF
jgi:hypothetical protein